MNYQTHRLKIWTLGQLLADDTPKPKAIIAGGILNAQSLLLITGQPKSKKSFLSLNMGIAIASGHSFACFTVTRPHKVLVLAGEGGQHSNKERLERMCSYVEPMVKDNFVVTFDSRFKFDNDESYRDLVSLVDEIRPEVLIIDPFVKFHSGDENSAKEMMGVLGRIRNVIEDQKLSVILVHHVGKSIGNGARGSSAILGEYDSHIQIEKQKEKQTLEFDMRHAETPGPIVVHFDSKSFWFERVDNPNPLIQLLQHHGELPKKVAVEKLVEGHHYKTGNSAYNKIKKEIENGAIVETDNKLRLAS